MTTEPQPERTDLAAWLLAQIAEDERVARECPEHHWTSGPYVGLAYYAERGEAQLLGPHWLGEEDGGLPMLSAVEAAHIARHDPARVLADCEAKRKIVELHRQNGNAEDATYPESAEDCAVCGWGDTWQAQQWGTTYPCDTLRLLAQPYADRAGFDEAWRVP